MVLRNEKTNTFQFMESKLNISSKMHEKCNANVTHFLHIFADKCDVDKNDRDLGVILSVLSQHSLSKNRLEPKWLEPKMA